MREHFIFDQAGVTTWKTIPKVAPLDITVLCSQNRMGNNIVDI